MDWYGSNNLPAFHTTYPRCSDLFNTILQQPHSQCRTPCAILFEFASRIGYTVHTACKEVEVVGGQNRSRQRLFHIELVFVDPRTATVGTRRSAAHARKKVAKQLAALEHIEAVLASTPSAPRLFTCNLKCCGPQSTPSLSTPGQASAFPFSPGPLNQLLQHVAHPAPPSGHPSDRWGTPAPLSTPWGPPPPPLNRPEGEPKPTLPGLNYSHPLAYTLPPPLVGAGYAGKWEDAHDRGRVAPSLSQQHRALAANAATCPAPAAAPRRAPSPVADAQAAYNTASWGGQHWDRQNTARSVGLPAGDPWRTDDRRDLPCRTSPPGAGETRWAGPNAPYPALLPESLSHLQLQGRPRPLADVPRALQHYARHPLQQAPGPLSGPARAGSSARRGPQWPDWAADALFHTSPAAFSHARPGPPPAALRPASFFDSAAASTSQSLASFEAYQSQVLSSQQGRTLAESQQGPPRDALRTDTTANGLDADGYPQVWGSNSAAQAPSPLLSDFLDRNVDPEIFASLPQDSITGPPESPREAPAPSSPARLT